jgi:hypothetical protein
MIEGLEAIVNGGLQRGSGAAGQRGSGAAGQEAGSTVTPAKAGVQCPVKRPCPFRGSGYSLRNF